MDLNYITMPKTSYSSQLENLVTKATNDVNKCIRKLGDKSDLSHDPTIKINDVFDIKIEGMTITEVAENNLIDESGYHYDFEVLEVEYLMEIADYISNL